MTRPIWTPLLALIALAFVGCAAAPKAAPPPAGVPGLTEYYRKATAPHRRAVRKPVRDERTLALHMLARRAGALLDETETWDSSARLAALAETQQPAAREAVADFRTTLTNLQAAAAQSDVGTVRQQYARLLSSYRHLNDTFGPHD
jgi:hypothetical protein